MSCGRDRVAVKPHASPVFHAIQYLFGRQTREKLERFRAFGGAQAYPSRTKDADDVDFSTGSVGLGVAMTSFAALVHDYLRPKRLAADRCRPGRMIALLGDAEFDEGNIFEALLEGWKHDIRNVWWIIDYNRQSLDAVVSDRIFQRIDSMFRGMDWRVVTLKYGPAAARRRSCAAAATRCASGSTTVRTRAIRRSRTRAAPPGGSSCSRSGRHRRHPRAARRARRRRARTADDQPRAGTISSRCSTRSTASTDDRPTCFIAYTIKGYGLPFAGHKDNHAGMMTPEQVESFKRRMDRATARSGSRSPASTCPSDELRGVSRAVPFAQPFARRHAGAARCRPERVRAAQRATRCRRRRASAAARRTSRASIPSSPIASSRRRRT